MLQKFEFHKTERKIFIKSVITAIDAVRPKDFYFPGEMHNFWEIVCVAEGAAMATNGYITSKKAICFFTSRWSFTGCGLRRVLRRDSL